ncbi:MAG: 4-hydroxy-tetrahydrodipicolinate reductase [Cyclobacteriaceae bacterium]|nr:4-hydroxy-tetrahydrodipicolinate reductase [Cyclobacteriaceae bacterium]MCH8516640.1 4-hydroxy-tetrahydrodipicolinate reductase [Cyclobacteriaceae bacterium]
MSQLRIALVGYGKMGQEIEKIAIERGHRISAKITIDNKEDMDGITKESTDAVIEFTQPDAAFENITFCLKRGLPVVSGTTGWLDKKSEADKIANENEAALLQATNFSLGVNITFMVNEYLATLMSKQLQYQASIHEIHHTAKLDSPSGTAISLAEGLINMHDSYNQWQETDNAKEKTLGITAAREDSVPGTHTVTYNSSIDKIELTHIAHNRKGFALGAVMAAEFLHDKKGVFNMRDFLKEELGL